MFRVVRNFDDFTFRDIELQSEESLALINPQNVAGQ